MKGQNATIARRKCMNCGNEVRVKINSGDCAYYRCEDCFLEVRHHDVAASKKWLGLPDEAAPKPIAAKPAPAPEKAAPPVAKKASWYDSMGAAQS